MPADPLSSMLLDGLGTIFKMGAELKQGDAAKQALDLSAQYSQKAAADAVASGLLREYEITARGSAIIAEQRASSSTGNLDVNVGAQQSTEQASRANLDFDRALVRRNAQLEAYGLRAKAQQQYTQGDYAYAESRNAAVGTFLSGLGSEIKDYGKFAVDQP